MRPPEPEGPGHCARRPLMRAMEVSAENKHELHSGATCGRAMLPGEMHQNQRRKWGKERRVVGPSVRKGFTQVRLLTTFIKGVASQPDVRRLLLAG